MLLPQARTTWIERWMPPKGALLGIVIILLLLMMCTVDALIITTGGIKYSTIHLMYIPIILSGVMFSWPGGLLAGIVGGLLAGPYMPLDIVTGDMQASSNWIVRMGFFSLIGTFSGFMSGLLVNYIKHVQWIAHHHIKSELPNRLDLETELEKHLQKNAQPFHLVIIAILNYDHICDLFGYSATDELVHSLQQHIAERFPRIPYYSHYHPERLAMIIDKNITKDLGPSDNPLVALLAESLPFNHFQVHLHTAIGFVDSTYKKPVTPEGLIQMAEIALYHARTKRMETCLYTDNIETLSKDSLMYLGALREAIQHQELTLYYQPKQNIQTGEIAGAEALIRWNSPSLGFIPPDKFIPQAEQTQLIQPLTQFVIESAFAQLASLKAEGIPIKISINLATKNLSDQGLLSLIADALKEYQLDPQYIDFEITESAVMDDPDAAIRFMDQLKEAGYSLSIDDYGIGYASLSYLKKLPINTLKIDQSFIKDILTQRTSQEIVSATIKMSKALGLTVIAEGVESQDTVDLLKSMGCDAIQGYIYSKPLTFPDFLKFIHNKKASHHT